MSRNRFNPTSTVDNASFHSLEELTEFACSTGREAQYRQLSKGRITSRWRYLHLGQFSLKQSFGVCDFGDRLHFTTLQHTEPSMGSDNCLDQSIVMPGF